MSAIKPLAPKVAPPVPHAAESGSRLIAQIPTPVVALAPRPAVAPPALPPNPFLEPGVPSAPTPVITHVAQSPAPTFSIMPFDGAKKRRRFIIAIVSALTLIVGTFVTISIVSQMH